MSREIEMRFAVREDDLGRFASGPAISGFAIGPAATRRLNTTYFDTAKLAFAKAGLSLRVRKNESGYVQTVKDESTGAIASERHEYECALPSSEPDLNGIPDEDVRKRLKAIAGSMPVAAVIETDIRRTTRSLKSATGDKIELAVDHGEIRPLIDGQTALPVSELELELKEGAKVALYQIARQLSREAPLTINMESKSARGLRALEGSAISAHKAGRSELRPDCTAEDAFCAILSHCLSHIARNTSAIVDARLPEGVHQIRVGLRRLRAALSAFGKEFRTRTLESLGERANTLSDVFGGTRELDVFSTELLAPIKQAARKPGLPMLRLILEELRRESWDSTAALVQSDDFTGFLLDLAAAIETRVWSESASAAQMSAVLRPAREMASESLDKRLKQAAKRARHLSSLNVEERHRLRIALKKLRYSAEFFAPLFGTKPASVFLDRLSKLQDLFGTINDAATAEHILHRILEHAGERRGPELVGAAAFVDGWHQSRIGPTWDKAKNRWKRFLKADPFWKS